MKQVVLLAVLTLFLVCSPGDVLLLEHLLHFNHWTNRMTSAMTCAVCRARHSPQRVEA